MMGAIAVTIRNELTRSFFRLDMDTFRCSLVLEPGFAKSVSYPGTDLKGDNMRYIITPDISWVRGSRSESQIDRGAGRYTETKEITVCASNGMRRKQHRISGSIGFRFRKPLAFSMIRCPLLATTQIIPLKSGDL